MARTKRLSHSNIIRPLCGLIYGEYLTLVLDVTGIFQSNVPLDNEQLHIPLEPISLCLTRLHFYSIFYTPNGRIGWAILRIRTRWCIIRDVDNSEIFVEPNNIEWEFHLNHPHTLSRYCWKNEKHSCTIIQTRSS